MTPTKVLFLDIDGVLNSKRSGLALGGRPRCFSAADMKRFDHVAVGLIRQLCKETGCAIVLSSDWRLDHTAQETAIALDLPVIDVTPRLPGTRGFEVNAWLNAHPHVTQFAIVDDIPQMFDVHERNFVLTDDDFGLSLGNYRELKGILMGKETVNKG